jgi:predicted DNA-binding protein (MmcQ/YjbR family)
MSMFQPAVRIVGYQYFMISSPRMQSADRQSYDYGLMPLDRLTTICLALPGASRELRGDHASFHVKKKVFAYFLNNHHGDGIVSVCVKALPGDNTRLIESDPKRFYLPAYIGPRGWVAYRLDAGKVDWSEVGELVKGSYALISRPTSKRSQR